MTATSSMIKEYLRKQLRYWIDNFKDEQLPRQFNTTSFNRTQFTLSKISLKPDKIAALLHLPSPLLITRAYCTEIHFRVPSWQTTDKYIQEPITLRIGELFIDICHRDECDEKIRNDAIHRMEQSMLEPDPNGSIASINAFAAILKERLELFIQQITIQLIENKRVQLGIVLHDFHARTTNGMWQDMRDLTDCVESSPDQLLQTRYKYISMFGTVLFYPQQEQISIPLLQNHKIALRITVFGYHGKETTQSTVVDLNLETLRLDAELKHILYLYDLYKMIMKWRRDIISQYPPIDHSSRDLSIHQVEDNDVPSTFALQVTIRFTAHIMVTLHSEQKQEFQLAFIVQNTALNWIVHRNQSTEIHITFHELSLRHKANLILHLKPSREALVWKPMGTMIFLKWHIEKLSICLESHHSILANELYHSFHEKEQAAVITCGKCHTKIKLESMEHHICTSVLPTTGIETISFDSTKISKIRMVFQLDELELVTDSNLFRSVSELVHATEQNNTLPKRQYLFNINNWSISTELKEYIGDAIFVPVLPLAFQMLECTIRGCGCVHQSSNDSSLGPTPSRPQWPDRVFSQLGHLSLKSICNGTKHESFVIADTIQLRSRYSDGINICLHSQPQMCVFVSIERLRCQLEREYAIQLRDLLIYPIPVQKEMILTLFLGVIKIHNIELTLLHQPIALLTPWKNQFRHVETILDNLLGYLSVQTNFDFRALFSSRLVQYSFEYHEPIDHRIETKRSRRRNRELASQHAAATRIQSIFRRLLRNQQVHQVIHSKQHQMDTVDSVDVTEDFRLELLPDSSKISPTTPHQEPLKRKSSSTTSLFGVVEDRLHNNTIVAAASAVTGGLTRYVIAGPQFLGNEMSEIARHSKESAAKFIPGFGTVKNMLTTKSKSEKDVKVVETRKASIEEVATVEEFDTTIEQVEFSTPMSLSDFLSEVSQIEASEDETDLSSDQHIVMEDAIHFDGECEFEESELDGDGHVESGDMIHLSDDENPDTDDECMINNETSSDVASEPVSANAIVSDVYQVVANMPLIVRISVQVEIHRLCVPINPRASVGDLCQEIVKRYNAMFGHTGHISNVTLQSQHGSVVAPSDTVGLIYTNEGEIFLADPHRTEKSTTQLSGKPNLPSQVIYECQSQNQAKTKVGCKFTRCSKLPLPLVVALLANESEHDLMKCILRDRSGDGNINDWPELTLDASFLETEKHVKDSPGKKRQHKGMLQVEVRWNGQCLEVTNEDAFLLCLQQLGLCTSQANSKYIGKILRDRLKMDVKNPLIQTACATSPEFQKATQELEQDISYESLKEIVQEDYGVYVCKKE